MPEIAVKRKYWKIITLSSISVSSQSVTHNFLGSFYVFSFWQEGEIFKLFPEKDNLFRFLTRLWLQNTLTYGCKRDRKQEEKAGMHLPSEGWISGFVFKKYLSCCTWSSFPFLWTVTKGNPFCRVQVFIIFFTSSVLFVTYIKKLFLLKNKSFLSLHTTLYEDYV